MNNQEFAQLTQQGLVILDGATGSNLTKAGMPKGISTELWTLEHAEVLIKLQREYVEAGTQIVYAPTFAANRISLANYGMADKVEELNTRLVGISKEAVGGRAYIAGDLTTTGKLMEPKGEITYEELLEAYIEQITALANAGVDLLVAETMMCVDEMMVALDAAQSVCDLPVLCSMTVEADGSGFFGGNAVEAMESLQEMGAAAVGINCSMGPDQMEAVVASMKRIARIPVIAKPNAGMPVINERGEAIYNMEAGVFAKHMPSLVEAGAGVIGGCCGTDPDYIRAMVAAVKK